MSKERPLPSNALELGKTIRGLALHLDERLSSPSRSPIRGPMPGELFLMHVVDEKPLAEIARDSGVPETVLQERYSAAVDLIRIGLTNQAKGTLHPWGESHSFWGERDLGKVSRLQPPKPQRAGVSPKPKGNPFFRKWPWLNLSARTKLGLAVGAVATAAGISLISHPLLSAAYPSYSPALKRDYQLVQAKREVASAVVEYAKGEGGITALVPIGRIGSGNPEISFSFAQKSTPSDFTRLDKAAAKLSSLCNRKLKARGLGFVASTKLSGYGGIGAGETYTTLVSGGPKIPAAQDLYTFRFSLSPKRG